MRESHLMLYGSFFFFMIFIVFLTDFSFMSLDEFFFIPSMGLGARMSIIIYLQSWNESMALAPSIWRISPISHKT
jgi:hypothetical protein